MATRNNLPPIHSGKSAGNVVRVVGMDEGNATSKTWLKRMFNIGEGPPQHDMIQREFGKLVIDEGKSQYISSSFWTTLNNEVSFMSRYPLLVV